MTQNNTIYYSSSTMTGHWITNITIANTFICSTGQHMS